MEIFVDAILCLLLREGNEHLYFFLQIPYYEYQTKDYPLKTKLGLG